MEEIAQEFPDFVTSKFNNDYKLILYAEKAHPLSMKTYT